MLQISANKPLPGVMFGLTHDVEDGSVIVREPRILKVGIGLPRGRSINVWIQNDGKWKVRVGYEKGKATIKTLDNAREAEDFYRTNYEKAPVCPYPRKTGFFCFTRPVIGEDGAEVFEPDFQAIEAHGATPTEIDIVFLEDDPFNGAYQMWSASELRCKGDGLNALRVLSMASTQEEKRLAQEAKENGEKYFPIVGGCWTRGCPYSKEQGDKPSPCKPGGDLKFQLARNIRVGGTAYFHTSGFRSIANIFSSLERIKTLTGGRLAGIPLKMVLRPYRTKHNGQVATQYGVSLEFRAEDVESLRKNLMEQALRFRQVAAPVTVRRMIEAPTETSIDEEEEEAPISAAAMAAEFYDPDDGPAPAPSSAKAATDQKTADLAAKLAEKSAAAKPRAEEKPAAAPQQTEEEPGPQPGDLY